MSDLEWDNKVKYFLIFMMVFPIIGLFGWIFWGVITDDRTGGEIFLSSRKEINCVGRVDSIYRQKMNHNILTLRTENCIFQVEAEWESKFQIGDSISKKKGELIVRHYRNGQFIEVLDYRDVAKNIKDFSFN